MPTWTDRAAGIAGSVGQEDAVGFERQSVVGGKVGRDDLDGGVGFEPPEHRLLHPEVVGHHPERSRSPRIRRRRRHLRDEVAPARARFGSGRCGQRRLGSGAEGAAHGAVVAQMAGQAPGVDTGDTGDAVADEEVLERPRRPPVRRPGGELADDDTPAPRARRLVIGGGDAVVPDMGIREGDGLTGVTGIGDHLLVTAENGVEDQFPGGHPARGHGADGLPLEDLAVGQDEESRCRSAREGPGGHRCASVSTTTGSPR